VYSQEIRFKAVDLRIAGWSLNEISRHLHVAKSTLSLWLRDVPLPPASQERLQKRIRQAQILLGARRDLSKRYARLREEAYARGLASEPSTLDALCIGLYWGEGSKHDCKWRFVNSDREMVAQMVQWAIRAGQSENAFRASVQTHPEDETTDDEIRAYWSEAGIPADRIHIYRYRTKSSKKLIKRKTPFGTCQLVPIRNTATLYQYFLGQRDRLLERAAAEKE
jgi:hypothetical protein